MFPRIITYAYLEHGIVSLYGISPAGLVSYVTHIVTREAVEGEPVAVGQLLAFLIGHFLWPILAIFLGPVST